jgi:hypothetical protein
MTHYAKVLNGIVSQVIVAEPTFFHTFVDTSPGTWLQTSYNTRGNVHYAANSHTADGGTPIRGNYAGVGYIYDSTHDVFYPPSPYPSWTLNTTSWTWQPPTPYPSSGIYTWNESTKAWVAVNT